MFDELVAHHEELSPPGRVMLPSALQGLSNGAFRAIRFRPERSLWRGGPGRFEAQFIHAGGAFPEVVEVFVLEDERIWPFPFSTHLFSYDQAPTPSSGAGLGFSGLRLHTHLNRTDYRDEVIVFEGGSYFRSLGKGQTYGLSARALAVDLGTAHPEEFPAFSRFYLVRPGADDPGVWILATLASARTHGVYAFYVQPGETTAVEAFARVWTDGPVAALGLAPMSSMYLFGEENLAAFGDYRPEVHDSDGLAFLSQDGEWMFRPLRNPQSTATSVFRLDHPKGFGLVQRDRVFASYQDLEMRYEARPSLWVEPLEGFGKGSLYLVEIATELESDDNIALAWVPEQVPQEGLSLHYRLRFGGDEVTGKGPGGRTVATRVATVKDGHAHFVVDFVGRDIHPNAEAMARIDASGGRIVEQHVAPNPSVGGLRLSFEVERDPAHDGDVELRAFLREGADVVSETWSYRWETR